LFQVNEALKEKEEYLLVLLNKVVKSFSDLLGMSNQKSDESEVNNHLVVTMNLLTTLIPNSTVGRVSHNASNNNDSNNI
jgi:hypothetical protein